MKKEPFLQVSKRRNKARWQERLLIRFIALILALIVCGAVIVALVKMNPVDVYKACLLYTSPSPRDISGSRMPSSA